MSNNSLSAVFFDLDGTLLDTAPDFHAALNTLRAQEGLAELDYSITQQTVSNGAAALISAAFSHVPDSPDFKRLHQALLDLYLQNIAVHTRAYDGIAELLDWLDNENLPWGVVTNKPERFTYPLLEQLGLRQRCTAVICPDHVTQTKPHPEPLLLACQHSRCRPEQSVYIGDHVRDIEAGRNAGMKTIAALYGYLEKDTFPEHWGATHSVHSARDITPWLTSLQRQAT